MMTAPPLVILCPLAGGLGQPSSSTREMPQSVVWMLTRTGTEDQALAIYMLRVHLTCKQ